VVAAVVVASVAAATTADPAVVVAVVHGEVQVARMEVNSARPVAEMVAEVMVALMGEYAVETSVGLEQAGESLAMATEEAAKAAPVPPEARRGGSMTLLS